MLGKFIARDFIAIAGEMKTLRVAIYKNVNKMAAARPL
jgi:hypothetical protein